VEESEYISRFAKKLTIVHQFDKLTANKQAQDRVFANPKINILFDNEPRAFIREGDKIVTEVENLKTKERQKLVSDGVFIFIGMKPNIDLFMDKLELDRWGYIKTDEDMRTSIQGVYAVGDVISTKNTARLPLQLLTVLLRQWQLQRKRTDKNYCIYLIF